MAHSLFLISEPATGGGWQTSAIKMTKMMCLHDAGVPNAAADAANHDDVRIATLLLHGHYVPTGTLRLPSTCQSKWVERNCQSVTVRLCQLVERRSQNCYPIHLATSIRAFVLLTSRNWARSVRATRTINFSCYYSPAKFTLIDLFENMVHGGGSALQQQHQQQRSVSKCEIVSSVHESSDRKHSSSSCCCNLQLSDDLCLW